MFGLCIFWFMLKYSLGDMEYAEYDSVVQKQSREIKVYWNIPTFQCAPHKIDFSVLAQKYGFEQNENDTFRGAKISILYHPGDFPIIITENNKTKLQNGGIPQAGNISKHLELFQKDLNTLVPDTAFSGIGIIDFEYWRPIFRQNFGSLADYQDLSIKLERKDHPLWPSKWVKSQAETQFEYHARQFMEETLLVAKYSRPNATWGYYGYPLCFNMSPNNMKRQCPKEAIQENNRVAWLFNLVDNLYPSLYLGNLSLTASDKVQLIEGRIDESIRLRKRHKRTNVNIIPYFWYKYHDTKTFISQEDLFNSLTTLSSYNIDGLIIWGSSTDVSSKNKCLQLYKYIDEILGPLVIHILK